jgi:hypothetical protein
MPSLRSSNDDNAINHIAAKLRLAASNRINGLLAKNKTRRRCVACGEPLPPGSNARRVYCPEICDHRRRPAPAIYRFVCPDGRCYVGHTGNHHIRDRHGLSCSNSWIAETIATHPLETWTFEVLEDLPPGCSKETLRRAEQHHIEQLRSFLPEHGFNVWPAWWFGDTPGVLAGRARRAEETREMLRRKKLWWLEFEAAQRTNAVPLRRRHHEK